MYSRLTHYRIPATVQLSPITVKCLLWRHRNCVEGDSPAPSPVSCNAKRQLVTMHRDNAWTWPLPAPDDRGTVRPSG